MDLDDVIEREAIARSNLSWDLYTRTSDVAFAYFTKTSLQCHSLIEASRKARYFGAFVLRFASADAAAALEPTEWESKSLLPQPWCQTVPYLTFRELKRLEVPLPPRLMLKEARKKGCLLLSEIIARRGLQHFRYEWTLLQSSEQRQFYGPLPAGMQFGPHSSVGGVAGFLISLDIIPFEFNQQRVKSLYNRLEQWRAASIKAGTQDTPLPEAFQKELDELRQEILWDPVASLAVQENAARRRAIQELIGQS